MPERIDFVFHPGVIMVAVFFFLLANVFLAAVLYPYARVRSETGGASRTPSDAEPMVGSGEEAFEERVDAFLEEAEGPEASDDQFSHPK